MPSAVAVPALLVLLTAPDTWTLVGTPLSPSASQLKETFPIPGVAVIVGWIGGPYGVCGGFDDSDQTEQAPFALQACTWKVYAVPLFRLLWVYDALFPAFGAPLHLDD